MSSASKAGVPPDWELMGDTASALYGLRRISMWHELKCLDTALAVYGLRRHLLQVRQGDPTAEVVYLHGVGAHDGLEPGTSGVGLVGHVLNGKGHITIVT